MQKKTKATRLCGQTPSSSPNSNQRPAVGEKTGLYPRDPYGLRKKKGRGTLSDHATTVTLQKTQSHPSLISKKLPRRDHQHFLLTRKKRKTEKKGGPSDPGKGDSSARENSGNTRISLNLAGSPSRGRGKKEKVCVGERNSWRNNYKKSSTEGTLDRYLTTSLE